MSEICECGCKKRDHKYGTKSCKKCFNSFMYEIPEDQQTQEKWSNLCMKFKAKNHSQIVPSDITKRDKPEEKCSSKVVSPPSGTFNLSEKIKRKYFRSRRPDNPDKYIVVKDVKEFIRLLKEETEGGWQYHDQYGDCVGKGCACCANFNWILRVIEKLAGKDLK